MPDSIRPRTRRRPLLNRDATTLIEVIGTLSVLLVLGISSASILGAVTDIGARDNQAKQGRLSAERLAKVFRLDVHDAEDATVAKDQWPIEFASGTQSVRYDWDAQSHSIQRTASEDSRQVAIDRFQLSEHCDPLVSMDKAFVTMVLRDNKSTQPWIIEASRP